MNPQQRHAHTRTYTHTKEWKGGKGKKGGGNKKNWANEHNLLKCVKHVWKFLLFILVTFL